MMIAGFRRLVLALAATSGVFATLAPAMAEWPDRPITMVLPFPAGGPNDLLARVIAQNLSEKLGQQVIVDNKVGASGNIGANFVAKAKPDGYTLVLNSSGPALNSKFIFPSLPYDPLRDFTQIVLVSKIPIAFVARADAPFNDMKSFIAQAKGHDNLFTVAIAGVGSVSHIASELLQQTAGIKLVSVPYAGSTPIINALLSNSVDVASDLAPSHIPLLKENRYKGLGIAAERRIASLLNLPTVAEEGYPGFEASTFSAIQGPAGLPRPIVDRINGIVNAFLASDEGKKQLAPLEMVLAGGTPEDLSRLIDQEAAKWGPLIKSAGITAQ